MPIVPHHLMKCHSVAPPRTMGILISAIALSLLRRDISGTAIQLKLETVGWLTECKQIFNFPKKREIHRSAESWRSGWCDGGYRPWGGSERRRGDMGVRHTSPSVYQVFSPAASGFDLPGTSGSDVFFSGRLPWPAPSVGWLKIFSLHFQGYPLDVKHLLLCSAATQARFNQDDPKISVSLSFPIRSINHQLVRLFLYFS